MVDRTRDDRRGAGGGIIPMKAVIGPMPTGPGWAYELKWDGMRLVATCEVGPEPGAGRLTLRSARGNDVTATFPELAGLPAAVGISAVLDGEGVVFDGDGPSFGRLQNRMHVTQPNARLVADHPVVYLVFDLLELEGRSLVDLPYTTRRRLLRDLVDDGPQWRVPPHVEGDDGQGLLELARQRGLEGVVAKRIDSRYQPGGRSRDWVKVKLRLRQELVVGGWLPGSGALTGQIGSLLVGYHDPPLDPSLESASAGGPDSAATGGPGSGAGRLRFAGAVGSGLTDQWRQLLRRRFQPRPSCPFDEVPTLLKPPVWVEPEVVVEVEYGSWPIDGLIRHPVLAGLRLDKAPEDVTRELPPARPDVE